MLDFLPEVGCLSLQVWGANPHSVGTLLSHDCERCPAKIWAIRTLLHLGKGQGESGSDDQSSKLVDVDAGLESLYSWFVLV